MNMKIKNIYDTIENYRIGRITEQEMSYILFKSLVDKRVTMNTIKQRLEDYLMVIDLERNQCMVWVELPYYFRSVLWDNNDLACDTKKLWKNGVRGIIYNS